MFQRSHRYRYALALLNGPRRKLVAEYKFCFGFLLFVSSGCLFLASPPSVFRVFFSNPWIIHMFGYSLLKLPTKLSTHLLGFIQENAIQTERKCISLDEVLYEMLFYFVERKFFLFFNFLFSKTKLVQMLQSVGNLYVQAIKIMNSFQTSKRQSLRKYQILVTSKRC